MLQLGVAKGTLMITTFSNTPPAPSNVHRHGGEDFFTVAFDVSWGINNWSMLRPRLQQAKLAAEHQARKRGKGCNLLHAKPFEYNVMANGKRRGNKHKGQYFSFILECNELEVLIMDTGGSEGYPWNVVITAPGRACLNHGGLGSLKLMRAMINALGGTINDELLSRVDMCLDVTGVRIDPFYNAVRDHRFIAGHKEVTEIESNSRTIRIGKRPLSMTIYDKLAEVRSKRDPGLMELMQKRRWGDGDPDAAIRCEFSIGRAVLKGKGIKTPDDYFRKRGDLINDLCTRWFRFTDGPVDRRNTARAKIHPLWMMMCDGFAEWAGKPVGESLEPIVTCKVDPEHLLATMYGCISRVAKDAGKKPLPRDEFEHWILHHGLM